MSESGSGRTTNPNTPRSPEGALPEVFEEVSEGTASFKTTTTTSSASSSDHDLHPTWPTSLDVADIPAMANWGPSDQPLLDTSLGNLWFDLHWHISSHIAFFTLHASTIRRKRKTRGRGGRAVFYIYIRPDRIRQLSLDTKPSTRPLGVDSLLLSFELIKPLPLIVPMNIGDQDKDTRELMDLCHRLASQTSFRLHINISGKRLAVQELQQLCAAACGARLLSSDRHGRIDTLYHGQGGRIVEGATWEPPPLYSESAGLVPAVSPSGGESVCTKVSSAICS